MRFQESPMEGGTGVSGKGVFISSKTNKIRWKPREDTSTLSGNLFVTGSWDDESSNKVSLWHLSDSGEPAELRSSLNHCGDVNALQFLNYDAFITGSSSGSLHMYRISRESSSWILSLQNTWDKLHSGSFSSSASNGISCFGENFASAGEEGKVFVVNARSSKPIRTYENADSCSLTSVIFVKHDEILTSNMRGQMKLWDLRVPSQEAKPCHTFFLSNTDQIGITCMTRHPSQSHVVCTGSQDGMLAIWDLRSERHPVTLLSAHSNAVSEVQFHHQSPDHIFSCSQNGDIWHWDASAVTRSNLLNFGSSKTNDSKINLSSPWLSSEAVKHRVEITSLMSKQYLPINTLDVLGSSIIFGGDNEAIYIFSGVIL